MKVCEILNSLDSLPGVGKATASLFAGLNIFTVGDLLQFFPKSYEDRTKKVPLNQYYTGAKVHTVAKVIKHEWFGYGKMKTLKILIEDGTCEGELVAFPTETVYGLGASIYNDDAVANIYRAKGRPSDNPLIVHIAEKEDIIPLVKEVTPKAQRLIDAFFPAPLTVILPKSNRISVCPYVRVLPSIWLLL